MLGILNMKISREYEKSRGVVIFAFNTATVDYVSIAVNAAKLVNHTLNLPVTLITDKPVNNSIFDTVQIVENNFANRRIGYESGTHWRNGNRYSAYNLSPYDQTLLIDSDYLIFDKNLLKLFDCTTDYKIMYNNNFLNNPSTNKMGTISLDFVWATVICFNKTEFSELMFKLVKRIQDNYEYYRSLYHIADRNFRNDYAFAIANHIINGYTKEASCGILWPMLTVEDRISDIELHNSQLIIRSNSSATVIPRQSIHVIDKDYLLSQSYHNLVSTICQEN